MVFKRNTPGWWLRSPAAAARRAALQRDNGQCTIPGCAAPATIVDHIVARPRGLTVPCPADRLDNLRSLCATHDTQIKEDVAGRRRRGGRPVLRGCDVDGWPFADSRSTERRPST